MLRFIQIILTGLCMSLYFFPLDFWRMPGVNTKMIMAVVGVFLFVIEWMKKRKITLSKEFVSLLFFPFSVSLIALFTMIYNQTPDMSYASYFVSFSVWLGGAYAVCYMIRIVHEKITPRLIINYLLGVCIFQCISALVIDSSPVVRQWVDMTFNIEQGIMHQSKRLYGLSAHLDTAGARFSVVLAGCSVALSSRWYSNKAEYYYLLFGVMFVAIVGNIISRTTSVGLIIGVIFILLRWAISSNRSKNTHNFTWLIPLATVMVITNYFYNTNITFKNNLQFGFEGFFSLVETGKWSVGSNEKLGTMVEFPESLKTWVIGDGYFVNPKSDLNYLGHTTELGYYMGTDIGYLRFIFYFGIIGLLCMMGVVISSSLYCSRHYPQERWVFILALCVGLIVWIKVSTDIFLFFALFIAASKFQIRDYVEQYKLCWYE